MESPAQLYTPFVPRRLLRAHERAAALPLMARAERLQAAVLFADVIGYTALTENYSLRGPEGIEQLESLLRAFFGRLEALVCRHGGDIVSFAGDSLCALWESKSPERLSDCVRNAARCALAAQDAVNVAHAEGATPLNMCVGVAAGDVLIATVGGIGGEWKHVIAGEAVSSALRALERGGAGIVVLAPDTAHCGSEGPDGGYVVLSDMSGDGAPEAPPDTKLSDEAASSLRCYIPPPVLEHLDAGQSEWLGEFRRATTVFIGIRDLDYRSAGVLDQLQRDVACIQEAIRRFEGTLARLIVDDKGTNVLSVWGIPGRSHEDDPVRAVSAALALAGELRRLGTTVGIGIATGRVLCGLSGGGARYEYTVTGDAVNLAARLMTAAADEVLCDAATSDAARSYIAFGRVPDIRLKGKTEPVHVERACTLVTKRDLGDARAAGHTLLGRRVERERLAAAVAAVCNGASSLITLEGEPGVGKSRLVAELAGIAGAQHACCLVGRGNAVERNTTYSVWRAILEQILEREAGPTRVEQHEYLQALFHDQPLARTWLPLLNSLMNLGLPETGLTTNMQEQARAESTNELIMHLLYAALRRAPTVIVLEDAHWMDSMSWDLLVRVQRRVHPLFILLVTRSGYVPPVPAAGELLASVQNTRIGLGFLSRDDTERLIRERLKVQTLAPQVLSLVHSKTEGHPLFTEEVAYALRDSGYIRIVAGHCDIAAGAAASSALELPETIEGVIASRIDRLSASQQLTLKIASIAGRGFTPDLISEIHPVRPTLTEILDQFTAFIALDLIRDDAESDEPRFMFKHAITQQVTYDLLPLRRRRELHRALARRYERTFAADLAAAYPLLAHHWSKAEDAAKAMHFLHKAGDQALHRYANREAAEFLEEALRLYDRCTDPEARALRAGAERSLGYARLWLGQLDQSQDHLDRSFEALGRPMPRSYTGLSAAIAAELVTAMCLRLAPPVGARRREPDVQEKDAVMAMLRLGHIAYFKGDMARSLYTSLRCLNYAARRKPSSESALIYAANASAAGMVPVHALARRYIDVALACADAANDPSITAQVLLFVSMYGAGVGAWKESLARVERAQQLGEQLGDTRRMEECNVVAGYLHFHAGRFDAAERCYQAVAGSGRERADGQTMGWGLLGLARVWLAKGEIDRAREALDEVRSYTGDRLSQVEFYGMLALVLLRSHDPAGALKSSSSALVLLSKVRPSSFSTLCGTAAAAETLVNLWALARKGHFDCSDALLESQACKALAVLRQFSRIFPIGLPQAALQQGTYWMTLGRRHRALARWRAGLRTANALEMPHDEARIALAIARCTGGPVGAASKARATTLLRRLGVRELERVDRSGTPVVQEPVAPEQVSG